MPSRDFYTLSHKSQMSAPFFLFFAHVVKCVPAEPFTKGVLCFLLLSQEMWYPSRPKYPKKCKYLAEKKQNKKNICKRLARGIVNTCAQFQGLSLKNGVGIGHGIWGFMLEPALRTLGNTPSNVVLTLYVTIPVMDL